MKKCKNLFIIFFLIYIIFFLTGCTQNNQEDLKSKVIAELDYVNTTSIKILNKLNNLSFENYSIISQQVKLNEDNEENQNGGQSQGSSQSSGQGEQSSGQGGQSKESSGSSSSEGTGGSSDTKGAEEKQEKEGESQDKVNTTTMITNTELNKNRDDIDWTEIKKEIELLNESWSVIVLDLYALDVKNDTILSFSDKLNVAMIAAKGEDKAQSLTAVADLYSNLPDFLKEIGADKNKQKLRQTQSNVINAYVLANDMENTVIDEHLKNAVTTYSEIMSDIDYIKDKTEKTNKIYVLLNEMVNSVDEKDTDVFYIKYKNFMKEVESM